MRTSRGVFAGRVPGFGGVLSPVRPSFRALLVCTLAVRMASAQTAEERAREIIEATGVRGGLVVHLPCGDGELTAALRRGESYRVHGLDRRPAMLRRARERILSRGIYGEVSVDRLRGERLPYIDGLVNLLVSDDLGGLSMDEVLRVLVPGGVAYIKRGDAWEKTIKPRPESIDDWTHFSHDASGNAVAHDTVVGPPRHLQWLGSPRWSRHHDRMASMSALVSERGRIFYIMDEGSRVSIQLPPKWRLIARDAFNGTVLWKRRIPTWHSHLWPLKSGPTQLARRLVAVGGRVYVTLGLEAPVTALDAASGETLRSYEGSKAAEELIVSDGMLFVQVNRGVPELRDFQPLRNVGDQQRVANEFLWNGKPRQITAYDADSGRLLWKRDTPISPLTLASLGPRLFYHDGEKVVCLDRESGEEIWSSAPVTRRKQYTMNFGPKLVACDDVVLFAGGDRRMCAFAAADGRELWSAPHGRSGYQSPEDLLVIGGLVWSAPTTSTKDSGVYTGRDLHDGEVQVEFPPDVSTYWFHHRCYMAKATDRFLLPSRTGVEFVDPVRKHWEIHHWVRGGCLYGVMPCNGLLYAPPHDCACYPEAKLFGFNALAPASPGRSADAQPSLASRREEGPAYAEEIEAPRREGDWPTYRHDALRSGRADTSVAASPSPLWRRGLGGRLSAPVIAAGRVLVAACDQHTVHALDENTGATLWRFTAGGRVDSPPTAWQGRVLFGSADGSVYCLRASDGELIWRFRAAPRDLRLMAFEQLESVWPVHGSVLVEGGEAFVVAGRSNFLDGGLRFYRLDAKTGRMLASAIIDERDPLTGENVQTKLQILNMTAGLPDILSSDGKYVYMRSQRCDLDGNRLELEPHSGKPAEQGAAQRGEGRHLFAPMGFLDDSWFHRSYWVYGRSFAGGHAGYYQAGKYAPSGRIVVFDDETVYAFARKPEYYRWTTTLEHQLFAASKEPPVVPARKAAGPSMVRFKKSASIDPTGKPVVVEAWIRPEGRAGVVVARGGPSRGYALYLKAGKPHFAVRVASDLFMAAAEKPVGDDWTHLVGMLTSEKELRIYVNGELAGRAKSSGLITEDPAQSLEIGADAGSAVGDYRSPLAFSGIIDEVRIYHGQLDAEEIQERFNNLGRAPARAAKLILSCSFDAGDGKDDSGLQNHGEAVGVEVTKGRLGNALKFRGGTAPRGGGSFVRPHWVSALPLLVRAMVLSDRTLFVAGPPDLLDEEKSFAQIVGGDSSVRKDLLAEEAALHGEKGMWLLSISASTGKKQGELKLPSLPVWDGLAAASGRLFMATTDGSVLCLQ